MRPALHGAAPLAVGFYRVSTTEQGHSGLGLEAQQASVRAFVEARAGRWSPSNGDPPAHSMRIWV